MDRLTAWGARLFCTDRYQVYDGLGQFLRPGS
jgi:hypothetical protein